MRELLTKPYEVGEHVMIDGVEYVVDNNNGDGTCSGCSLKDLDCHSITCGSFIFKKFKPEPRLMTNRELAEWLARGNGQLKYVDSFYAMAITHITYNLTDEDKGVNLAIRIRPWGDDLWVNPTYDIYKRDCS